MLPILGNFSKILRNWFALVLALVSFILSLILLPSALSGQFATIQRLLPLGFNFTFCADGLAVFMALVSSFISAIIIFYSFDYIDHYENQNEYYCMVLLFMGSMMGLVYSGNLIFLYVFWEITALTSWRLIGFFRDKEYVIKADKAFLVTVFGALLMLVGFMLLAQQCGSFDLSTIKEALKTQPLSGLAVLLILAGIFSKSATLPFQTWLPDAGVAPSPVTALLHAAVLVKIGVYVFARLFIVVMPLSQFWHVVVPAIAGLSALIAAGAALIDTNLKRIIAFSTISQIGFIFLGLACGNVIGVTGALLYILMHGLAKGGLFLCAGIVEQNTHSKDITKMGGLIKTMPWTAMAFLFCAFSIMGIPPLGGFFAKFMVMTGSVYSQPLYITLLFLCSAFFTILYLFRVFNLVFLGNNLIGPVKEGSKLMVACVVLLAVLSFSGGLLIKYPADVARTVAQQMLGTVK